MLTFYNTTIKYIILPSFWTVFIPLIIVLFNLIKTNFNTDSVIISTFFTLVLLINLYISVIYYCY